jgi:acetyl esterase/lipase
MSPMYATGRNTCPGNAADNLQYTNRKPRAQKPTAHIAYDEGLSLVRAFLEFASHKTVEDLQAFTSRKVPHARWVKVDSITIPHEKISSAAEVITEQLGHHGIDKIGGSKWWQWRQKGAELRAEWIEVRGDYEARKKANKKSRRIMMYVHGGAYFFGSVDEHRYQLQRHARKLKARVLAPRYRLSPQYPFPCGLLDCLATYLYLLTIQDPTEIILAGDSAGGGMVVTMLCILRDRGLPLPAGAILISPWVDLTHSFPSVAGDSNFDFIPSHGFMQKPSVSWPPPNDDEMEAIAEGAVKQLAHDALPRKSTHRERKDAEDEAIQGFAVYHTHADEDEQARKNSNNPADAIEKNPTPGNTIPGPGHQLSIQIDGKMIVLKDQIQMYATNQLISHPLVSPVLQPSLGGLPPLLIMTGGGEVLRDEQIYLAHKAAHPERYPLGDAYQKEYDPENEILHKYKPTPVQLQVWDDLCHVAPTLSFTRPAKFMYKSVAQFGAWALARAQKTSIEIQDDDSISVISSGSDTESDTEESMEDLKKIRATKASTYAKVGRAGDPLPSFKNHMIRQRVDRHGDIFPLAPESELPALQLPKDEVGVIKPEPVRKWMEAKKEWDGKYSRIKRRLQKQKIKDMNHGGPIGFGAGESPPPSALAGRRKKDDLEAVEKKKRSYGLAMWSGWGSKHDKHTLEREEKAEKEDKEVSPVEASGTNDGAVDGATTTNGATLNLRPSPSRRKESKASNDQRSRSRRRTVTVTDTGQTEDQGLNTDRDDPARLLTNGNKNAQTPNDNSLLAPMFAPKYKNLPSHLRNESKDDAASVLSGNTTGDVESLRNASTMAVFAAPGVLTSESRKHSTTQTSSLSRPVTSPGIDDDDAGLRSEVASTMPPETPASSRSVERLQSHQDPDHDNVMHLRNPSNVAFVGSEGIVGEVNSGERSSGL